MVLSPFNTDRRTAIGSVLAVVGAAFMIGEWVGFLAAGLFCIVIGAMFTIWAALATDPARKVA